MTDKYPVFSADYGWGLIRFLEEKGISLDALLHSHGIEEGAAVSQWSSEFLEDILAYAWPRYPSPDTMGKDIAHWLNLSAAGIVGQLCLSAPNVQTALEVASQYSMLGCPAVKFQYTHPRIHLTPDPAWMEDFNYSPKVVIPMVKSFIQIFMKHLGLKVYFDSNYSFELSDQDIKKSLSPQQGQLFETLIQFAQTQSIQFQQSQTWSNRIHAEFSKVIGEELPSLTQLAKIFNYSPRNLQRKLKDEGLIYQDLKNEFRNHQITTMLRQGYGASAIYVSVGFYSEQALSKYFKKQFNQTISEFVQAL